MDSNNHEQSKEGLPVGELKWSKEEEQTQDTKINLNLEKWDMDATSEPVIPSLVIADGATQDKHLYNELIRNKGSLSDGANRRAKLFKWITVGFGVLLVGIVIGYTIFGHKSLIDIFSFKMWKHMLELLFG